MSTPAVEATFACPPGPAVVLVVVEWRTRRGSTWVHAAYEPMATNHYHPPERTLCGRRIYDCSALAAEDVDGREAVCAAVTCNACRRIMLLDPLR